MAAIYWLAIHPVNRLWLEGRELAGIGSAFFGVGQRHRADRPADWTALRDRWEYAHAARAGLSLLSLLALLIAVHMAPRT